MCVSQISIQRQRLLAFGNTLGRTARQYMHSAQIHVGPRMLRVQRQSGDRGRFSRCETDVKVIGQNVGTGCHINLALPTSASMFSGSSASARSKKSPARAMFSGVGPLLNQA